MDKIILNVPFSQKDVAKKLGARWDPIQRYWYITGDSNASKFTKWIVGKQSTESADGSSLSLCQLLTKVSDALSILKDQSIWVCAEIVKLIRHKSGHIYLELAEHNENGMLIAKCSGVIWRSSVGFIDDKFFQETRGSIHADIKVLLKVYIEYDCLYGLKLIVEDIDPTYTLGDMHQKMLNIKKQLMQKGVIENNKSKSLEFIHNRVAVIAPENAAGLGDFMREASLLLSHKVCHFDYYHSVFQGDSAADSIIKMLKSVQKKHLEKPYDFVVIIRGGGSVTDLAWLNDYNLAKMICDLELPVLCGIGHRQDQTIIDIVAHTSFDTPSKVSHYIYSSIVNIARDFSVCYREIWREMLEKIRIFQNDLDLINVRNNIIYSQFMERMLTDINKSYLSLLNSVANINSNHYSQVKKLFDSSILLLLQKNINYSWNLADKTFTQALSGIEKIVVAKTNTIDILINKINNNLAIINSGFPMAVSTFTNKRIVSAKEAMQEDVFVLQFRDGKIRVKCDK